MLECEEYYINFAPNSLASLTVDWDVTKPLYVPHQGLGPPPITRLTGLTRLEFSFCGHMTSAELLRDLPLEELLLLHCPLSIYEQLLSLFVPGALPLLQKLHIDNLRNREAGFTQSSAEPGSDISPAKIEREEADMPARRLEALPYTKSLKQLAGGLSGLPSLRQVSGCSALFDFGMEDELKDWPMSRGIGAASPDNSPAISVWAPVLKVWSKA